MYVTTAYLTSYYHRLRRGVTYAEFLLVVLISLIALRFLLKSSKERADSAARLHLPSLILFGFFVVLFAFLVLFGHSALDYERCVIRSWLGSSLLVSLAFLLGQFRSSDPPPWRRLRTGLMFAFAVLVVIGSPAQNHTFGRGLLSFQALTVLLVAALPVILGLATLAGHTAESRNLQRMQSPVVVSRSKLWSMMIVLIGLGLLPSVVGGLFIFDRADYPHLPDMTKSGNPWVGLAGLLLTVSLGAFGVVLLLQNHSPAYPIVRRTSARERVRNILVMFVSLGALIALVAFLIPLIVSRSQFLSYQLANPRFDPSVGWWPLLALALVWVLYLGLSIRAEFRSEIVTMPSLGGLRAAALLAASLAFVDNNYLATRQTLTRAIICVDAETGEILWISTGLEDPEGQLHRMNTPATPTPVVYRDRIMAYFGSAGVLCVNRDGRRLWKNEGIRFQDVYGVGSSPMAGEGLLVIVNGMARDPHIVGLDVETGRVVWKTAMSKTSGDPMDAIRRTPLIKTLQGRPTLLVWGFDGLDGYDLRSGALIWSHPLGDGGGDMVASPVSDDERVYLLGATRSSAVELKKLGQPDSPVAWESKLSGPNCASPVLSKGVLFFVSDRGIASWVDASTGRRLGRRRLPGDYYASPVTMGDFVYFSNAEGLTTVLSADARFQAVAENALDEGILASFAPVQGRLIVRTEHRLLCIEEPLEETRMTAPSGNATGRGATAPFRDPFS